MADYLLSKVSDSDADPSLVSYTVSIILMKELLSIVRHSLVLLFINCLDIL